MFSGDVAHRFAQRLTGPALVASTALALAAPATAGQIIWQKGDASLWVMNDNGSAPRELIDAQQLGVALPSPSSIGGPDVFENGGTEVAFSGTTDAFEPHSNYLLCGFNCTGSFLLSGGTVTRETPAAGPDASGSTFELDPRLTADAQIAFAWSVTDSDGASITGFQSGLGERPLSRAGNVDFTPWSTGSNDLTSTLNALPAPDPADPTKLAWVVKQGCGYMLSSHPACQYEVHVNNVNDSSDIVSITDAEYSDTSTGASGPSSLSWSADGSELLLVDSNQPIDGIFEFQSGAFVTGEPVKEILAAPAGWTFTQARFAGSKIVFDATTDPNAASPPSDIYTVPATCTSSTCSFPGSATDLTNDPSADNTSPAWTSATTPIPALGGSTCGCGNPGPPPTTKLKLTISPASNQKVVKQKALVASFECNVACAFAAQGAVQIKGSKKPLLTKELGGSVAANRADKLTLKLSGSELSKIKTALRKHREVTAEVEVAVKDQAGAETQSSKQFTVKH